MDIKQIENINGNEQFMEVEYYQSTCLFILREDGTVVSTDNLNMNYSITKENYEEKFKKYLYANLNAMTQEEYDEFEEEVQYFLDTVQDDNVMDDSSDLIELIARTNTHERAFILNHGKLLPTYQ